jgi:hypothetical protein
MSNISSSYDLSELIRTQSAYAFNSEKFLFDVLKFKCVKWQSQACHDYDTKGKCAWSTGSGAGKTAILARLMLHFLYTRPFSIIPCTAPTKKQLYNVLWAEAGRAMSSSSIINSLFEWQQERIYFKTHKDKWFAAAITSTPPKPGAITTESLQGYHAENLLFIVDEASGISDQVMGAADGAMSTPSAKAILASNPTRNVGYFHRAMTMDALKDLWARIFVDVEEIDAEYIDKVSINRLKLIYGKNSDYFRMRVRGLAPRSEFNALVSPEQVYAAHKRIVPRSGQLYCGCDPARYGDDDTVIYVRDGNVIIERICVHGMSTVQVADALFALEEVYNFQEIRIDIIGIGSGVHDDLKRRLKEKAHKVKGVGVGEDANDKNTFFNKRAEIVWQIRHIIDSLSIIIDTPLLDEELSVIHYGWDSKDKRIKIEPKDETKKNIKRSPNDADALCLVCADLKTATGIVTSEYFKIGSSNINNENNMIEVVNNMKNEGKVPRAALDLATFLGNKSGKVGARRYNEFSSDLNVNSFGSYNDTEGGSRWENF